MDKELIITAANGTTYKFIEWMIFGHTTVSTYAMWDGTFHHICKEFNNLEEAKSWVAHFAEPVKETKYVDCVVPSDYYGVRQHEFDGLCECSTYFEKQ